MTKKEYIKYILENIEYKKSEIILKKIKKLTENARFIEKIYNALKENIEKILYRKREKNFENKNDFIKQISILEKKEIVQEISELEKLFDNF